MIFWGNLVVLIVAWPKQPVHNIRVFAIYICFIYIENFVLFKRNSEQLRQFVIGLALPSQPGTSRPDVWDQSPIKHLNFSWNKKIFAV